MKSFGTASFLRRVSPIDSSIYYIGKWETDGKRRFSDVAYTKCYFTFHGPTINVYAISGPDKGICEILLDGEFQVKADCYGESEKEICIFQKTGLEGPGVHNLLMVTGREKNAKAAGNILEIGGFEAVTPIDYAAELKRQCNREYTVIQNNLKTWKESDKWEPVPYEAVIPERGVVLLPGVVRHIYDINIKNIKHCASLPDYCEGDPPNHMQGEDRKHAGWSRWLPGSNEGRMLGGAAISLRWEEDPELRKIVDKIIGDMKNRIRDDGYYNYYEEKDSYELNFSIDEWTDRSQFPGYASVFSERKNYDRVFWTRGMIAAMKAGNPDSPILLRRMYDWFNKQTKYLVNILYGGNSTNGMPGGPLVYRSEIGKPEDMITNERYFDQDCWFDTLANRQPMAFIAYPGERPHCYVLLSIETIADEYLITGDEKYLKALLGAWEVYNRYYRHIGGQTAICEIDGPYPPGSYFITTGHNGETCGHVFWGWINERLMQLYPHEEKYIAQIEGLIYNTLLNDRTEEGHTRYHIRLHGKKDTAGNPGSCCQVSSTMAIASIPQYIYLTNKDGVFVNLFIPSEFDSQFGKIAMKTDFPFSGKVDLTIGPVQNIGRFNISIRVPGWALSEVSFLINGSFAGEGKPGERIVLNREWRMGDCISFVIPYGPQLYLYTGTDQSPDNYSRYTMLYGPVLMALNAPECKGPDVIPRIRMKPESLLAALKPMADNPLHFPVPGSNYTFIPYWDADDEGFTCVPVIEE
jgi:hypothetical protein